MSEPFFGEIQLFGFNFAPVGWAQCNGATLPVAQNSALFSLIGNTYGGDGINNFQLPNFGGVAPCNQGQGAGLTRRDIGQGFGAPMVTLSNDTIPQHTHALTFFPESDPDKVSGTPANGFALSLPGSSAAFAVEGSRADAPFAPNAVVGVGAGQPHENRQPYLTVNFCIALSGAFPMFD